MQSVRNLTRQISTRSGKSQSSDRTASDEDALPRQISTKSLTSNNSAPDEPLPMVPSVHERRNVSIASLALGETKARDRISSEASEQELLPMDPTLTEDLLPILNSPSSRVRKLTNFRSNDEIAMSQKVSKAAIKSIDQTQARDVAKLITEQLSSGNKKSRAIACTALGNMGELGWPYARQIAEVLTSLDDEDRDERWAAADALRCLGKAGIQELAALHTHGSPLVREVVLWELGEGQCFQHVQNVADLLDDLDESVRGNAVISLTKMHEAGYEYVVEVANLLSDNEPEVVQLAAAFITNACKGGVKHGVKMLSNIAPLARSIGVQSIADFGEEGQKYVSEVGKLVGDADADVDKLATDFVVEACKNPSVCVKMLTHETTGSRRIATESVMLMGRDAIAHVDIVMRMLRDADSKTRCSAVVAIGRMGLKDKADASRIASLTGDPDVEVRLGVVKCLAAMGSVAKPHAPKVFIMLEDIDYRVRDCSAALLRDWAKEEKIAADEASFKSKDELEKEKKKKTMEEQKQVKEAERLAKSEERATKEAEKQILKAKKREDDEIKAQKKSAEAKLPLSARMGCFNMAKSAAKAPRAAVDNLDLSEAEAEDSNQPNPGGRSSEYSSNAEIGREQEQVAEPDETNQEVTSNPPEQYVDNAEQGANEEDEDEVEDVKFRCEPLSPTNDFPPEPVPASTAHSPSFARGASDGAVRQAALLRQAPAPLNGLGTDEIESATKLRREDSFQTEESSPSSPSEPSAAADSPEPV